MSTLLPIGAEDYWVINAKVFEVVSFNILETGKFVVRHYGNNRDKQPKMMKLLFGLVVSEDPICGCLGPLLWGL